MNYRIFTGSFVSFHAYSCNKKVSILSKYIINKDLIVAKNGEAIAPSLLITRKVPGRFTGAVATLVFRFNGKSKLLH